MDSYMYLLQLKREMNLDTIFVVTSAGRLTKQSRDETGITENIPLMS